ncbi:MAG: alpha/beta fold hydrolase [Dehalococcoidia bacterium]|nr:alpha/beta fold hydrolase [Dehalococcoidia bacterium]
MPTGFAHVNGYRLRYRIEGDGPLAVFGHGLMGSIEQIDDNHSGLDALHERVRLLVYDARGHGQSDGPADPAGYTWETLGQDMAALAAPHHDGAAVFGGGSMGAATALWVALERPELVRGLVLVMPPPLGHGPMRGEGEQRAIMVLDMLAAAVENYGLAKTVELARTFPGFAATPEEADERARWMLTQNPLALAHGIRGLLQAPFHDPDCYRAIRVPTLVIAYEGDGLHPVRAAQLLGANIPDCRVEIADQPGYWREHPDEFLALVTGFLDRVQD